MIRTQLRKRWAVDLRASSASAIGGVGGVGGVDDVVDHQRRRALTLSLWRDYLCLLARMSPEEAAVRRASAAAEIRKAGSVGEEKAKKKDDDAIDDPDAGVKRLMAAVSFLRATTSRKPREKTRLSEGNSGGVFVVRKGELVRVEGGGDETTRSSQAGKLSPDEAFRKHRELMRRQFYGREPPRGAPGLF